MAEETINATQAETEEQTGAEKTFTQAEVDALIAKRIAREKKGMPSAEDLARFNEWQKTQQTDADRLGAMTKERDEANQALNDAKCENTLLRMGVEAEDVDYYVFKIKKLVTDKKDFETAAREFFKEKKPKKTVTVEMGAEGGNGGKTVSSTMNDLIRSARR